MKTTRFSLGMWILCVAALCVASAYGASGAGETSGVATPYEPQLSLNVTGTSVSIGNCYDAFLMRPMSACVSHDGKGTVPLLRRLDCRCIGAAGTSRGRTRYRFAMDYELEGSGIELLKGCFPLLKLATGETSASWEGSVWDTASDVRATGPNEEFSRFLVFALFAPSGPFAFDLGTPQEVKGKREWVSKIANGPALSRFATSGRVSVAGGLPVEFESSFVWKPSLVLYRKEGGLGMVVRKTRLSFDTWMMKSTEIEMVCPRGSVTIAISPESRPR